MTDLDKIASAFRDLMTKGQKMQKHNTFRDAFYDHVVRSAKVNLPKYNEESLLSHAPPYSLTDYRIQSSEIKYATPSRTNKTDYEFAPGSSFAKLMGILCPQGDGRLTPTAKQTAHTRKQAKLTCHSPAVVLAFDEAHTLTKTESDASGWSNFSVLQHALRGLNRFRLFSIFLSTTSKISQFTPSEDSSLRIQREKLDLIQPFTDIGFDPLADKVSLDGNWNLDALTGDVHIVHLGRPLYVQLIFCDGHYSQLRRKVCVSL